MQTIFTSFSTTKLREKRYSLLFYLIAFCLLGQQHTVHAEGTATISPSSANITALALIPSGGSGSYLGCSQDNRIYFNIANNATENLYFGFNWRNYASSGTNPTIANMYIKIFNPSGALVSGPTQLNNTGAGFISTYAQAIAGPNVAGSTPAGYTPLSFDPTVNGDYWVEIYRSNDGGVTQAANTTWSLAPYFDLTVATATGVRSNGRIHSDKWGWVAVDATFGASALASSEASVFAYTTDQTILKISFQAGFNPIAFDLAVNLYGVTSTGNYANDRKSINSAITPVLANGYPLFLNSPDPALYPIAAVPPNPTFASPLIIGCTPGNVQIRYTLPVDGDTRIVLDLNGVAGFQAGTADRIIEIFNQTAGFNVYNWDGLNGLGVPVTASSTFSLSLTALKGRFNVPVYDAEINKNGLKVASVAPIAATNITLYWDDANMTTVGVNCAVGNTDNQNNVVNAGISNVVGTLSPAHAWSGNGNPTQLIPAPAVGTNETDNLQCSDFGNVRVINTYGYAVSTSAASGNIVAFQCVTVAGTVWNDVNNSAAGTNSNIFSTGESGTNLSNTLFATLIDPATGNVLQSVPIASNGTYLFTNVPVNGVNMPVRLTNSLGVAGSVPPVLAVLPIGWTNTSPLSQLVTTGTVNITGVDFGVRQVPPIVTIGVNNGVLCVGGTATLTATASSGNGVYTYQWENSPDNATWTSIGGAQSATYNAPTATVGTMWYRNVVTSGGLSATSTSTSVTIVADPIVVVTTTAPTVCVGGSVLFTSTSSGGTGTCSMQWQSSPNGTTWTDISGATSSTYTTPILAIPTALRYRAQISCTGNGCCN
jgi:hypothetical protein